MAMRNTQAHWVVEQPSKRRDVSESLTVPLRNLDLFGLHSKHQEVQGEEIYRVLFASNRPNYAFWTSSG